MLLLAHFPFGEEQSSSIFSSTIKNFYPSFLDIDLSYDYSALPVFTTRLIVDDDGAFRFNQRMSSNGFVGFYHYETARYIRFWLAPNSQLKTSFDWQNPASSIRFDGQGSNENELLNSIDANREVLLASSTKTSQTMYTEALTKESTQINSAFKAGHISFEFHSIMSLDAKFFWLAKGLESGQLSPEDVLSKTKLSNSKAIGSINYFRFLRAYGLRAFQEKSQEERYNAFAEILSEGILELFWAYDIRQMSQQEEIDFSLLNAYQLYSNRFNNKALLAYAHKYLTGLEDELYRVNTPITKDLVLVENSSLSIADIVEKFKGEVLFFDMWATWCKPCIAEMGASSKKPLEEFIKDKPVKIIYLSVDKDNAAERWKEMAKELRLNSHNYRLSTEQVKEALNYLGEPTNIYSIPRYFIVSKEGGLVNSRAPYPSSGEQLYNELSKYF